MTTTWEAPAHPVTAALAAMEKSLSSVADSALWSVPDEVLPDLVSGVDAMAARMAELRLRVVREADRRDVASKAGATSTAAWLAQLTRSSRREASTVVALAHQLDRHAELTRSALGAGSVNVEQAQAIAHAVADLPRDVSPTDKVKAEAWLLEHAATFGPEELRRLGKRVFEVLAPEEADAREGELLEEEERRARRATWFAMRRRGDGTTSGGFRLPDAQADMLKAALDAHAAPRRSGSGRAPTDEHDQTPYPRRMGIAFGELIEHLPSDRLPQAGGVNATIGIDLDLESLRAGIGAATMSTGTRISAGQARRLACNAGLVPMVLDSASRVLDLGTSQRLFDRYQRMALARRDRGCVFPGCDRPPAWCEAHHNRPWSEAGPTDLANGSLLCGFHHHLVHDRGWVVQLDSGDHPELIDADNRVDQHQRFRPRRE